MLAYWASDAAANAGLTMQRPKGGSGPLVRILRCARAAPSFDSRAACLGCLKTGAGGVPYI